MSYAGRIIGFLSFINELQMTCQKTQVLEHWDAWQAKRDKKKLKKMRKRKFYTLVDKKKNRKEKKKE